jgi:hypothetical protein
MAFCLGWALNAVMPFNDIAPFTDIAVYGALFAALCFALAIHRAVSNYFRKREHGE